MSQQAGWPGAVTASQAKMKRRLAGELVGVGHPGPKCRVLASRRGVQSCSALSAGATFRHPGCQKGASVTKFGVPRKNFLDGSGNRRPPPDLARLLPLKVATDERTGKAG